MELREIEEEIPKKKPEASNATTNQNSTKETITSENDEECKTSENAKDQIKKRNFPFKEFLAKLKSQKNLEDEQNDDLEEEEDLEEEATYETETGEVKFIESLEYIKHNNEEEERMFQKKYRLFFTVFTDENTKVFNGEEITDEQEIDMSKHKK